MKPRVWFVASDTQGGGRVRSFWPAQALRDRGWEAHASTDYPPTGWVDVVVVHRPVDEQKVDQLHSLKRGGAIVLVDEDDCLHCIPDAHHAKALFTPERLTGHAHAIEEADGLVVSTPALAEEYGALAKQTWLARNYLPAFIGAIRWTTRNPGVRVGWQGIVGTHKTDLEWLAPVARSAIRGSLLSIVGLDPRQRNPAHVMGWDGATELFPFQTDAGSLYKHMARADIGIVPLAPNSFNRSKSWLKALEYMTLGKPVVVCDLPEQVALVEHGVTGFIASSPDDFAGYVQRLIGDPGLRQRMGVAARQVGRRLALEAQIENWVDILEDVTRGWAARNRTIIDEAVRCVVCGKMLIQRAARPWHMKCPRCKHDNVGLDNHKMDVIQAS